MIATGKRARKSFGNRHQIKRAYRQGKHNRTGWKAAYIGRRKGGVSGSND